MNPPEKSNRIASGVLFQEFCDLCDKIKNANAKIKTDMLQKYIGDFRSITPLNNTEADNSFFPILRILLPQLERDRSSYGIKETTLAKMYIRVLNLPKQGHEATKLINYKSPSSSQATAADFADVAFWILKSRCRGTGQLTVKDVNDCLDRMAASHSANQPRAVDDELVKMVSSMTASQQKWFIRIILKDMKLGMGQVKTLSTFHPDAQDLFDNTNSLFKVCNVLFNLNIHLHEIGVDIFSPFRPMLSDRLDIKKINSSMKKDEGYFLETKFDGERFQIHMKDGILKYFSRNAFDFTNTYGESYDSEGWISKHLKDALNSTAKSFIIDGEMMGWNEVKKAFGSKGMNFDVKKITEKSVFRPCFCAFDILLYNDTILTNMPLKDRMKYLDDLFVDKEGIIVHSIRILTNSSDEVIAALNKAIDDQEEGLVLKSINSLYKPNNRKGGWYKIKPEYTDGVMNELDLLIIGGYYTENRRHGAIGSVLLGVAVPPETEGGTPSVFHSVGKVKLSLKGEEIEELCSKLQPHWNPVTKTADCPPSVCWTKDKPDVWIEPEKSCILQIKASELTRSSAFKTNYTLRFPRIEKVRSDKPWHDCLTTLEFEEITKYSHGIEKLTARHIDGNDVDDDGDVSPRKRARLLEVASQFKAADTSNITEVSDIFAEKEFCVMTGQCEITKCDIERKIAQNGGKFVQNPGAETFCIIAGDLNARVKNVIKSGIHNVATVDWFLKSLQPEYIVQRKLLEWTPQDLIGNSAFMAEEFALKYDEYGDSYTVPATRESLKYSMKRVSQKAEKVYLLPSEYLEMDQLLFNGPNPYSFMRISNIHIFEYNDLPLLHPSRRKLDIMKIELNFFGGECSEILNEDVTHVLITEYSSENNIHKLSNTVAGNNWKPAIVKIDWLEECLNKRALLNTDSFKYNF